jgi:(+)-pinoresinol hydroxylase
MRIVLAIALCCLIPPAQAAAANSAAAVRGRELFEHWCSACHAPEPTEDGRYLPGTNTLQNRYKGRVPAALEQRTDLTEAYIEAVIRSGLHAMPRFRKTEISDRQMHDIAAYLAKGAQGAARSDGAT